MPSVAPPSSAPAPRPDASRLGEGLGRLALASIRRPGWVFAVLALVVGLAAVVAVRTPLDLSFAGLMDREHPRIRAYFAASKAYGLGGRLPLLVEPRDATDVEADAHLDAFADALAEHADADDRIASLVALDADDTTLDDDTSPAWFVSAHAFARWKDWALHPTDPQRAAALRRALDEPTTPPRHRTSDSEGARLLILTLAVDSFAQDLDAQDFPAIDAKVHALAHEHAVRARFAGMPAIVAQDEHATLQRIGVMTPLSLVLALALLLGMERRPLGLLAIAIPMVASAIITIALMGLVFGRITVMESLFGVLVFGLGVDFALHLGLRTREATAARLDFEPAVFGAFARTGPGVVIGGFTTAGAFAVLALAPEPSFVHLGVSGAVGIVTCLFAMLTVLPAAWSVLGAGPRGPRRRDEGVLAAAIAALSRSATRSPRTHIMLALGVVIAAGLGLGRLTYESDLNRVVNRGVEAVPTAEEIHARFGVHPMPWVVATATLDEARAVESKLGALDEIGETESLARWFPADQPERATWLRDNAEHLRAVHSQVPAAAPLLDPLLQAAEQSPPDPFTDALARRTGLVTEDDQLLVFAFAQTPHMDAERAAAERVAVTAVAPEATSMAVLFELLLAADRPWMPPLVGGALGFVALMLLLDLRRPHRIALALIPVVAASVAAFGLLGWLGIALNTVTLMAAPLVLGLGVDDGIHVVHRLRDRADDPDSIAEATASVSHAIALTTATTCTSFSTLLLSGHPGLESMAWIMLLALPACLLASASTLPAAAMLLRRP